MHQAGGPGSYQYFATVWRATIRRIRRRPAKRALSVPALSVFAQSDRMGFRFSTARRSRARLKDTVCEVP